MLYTVTKMKEFNVAQVYCREVKMHADIKIVSCCKAGFV